MREPATRFLVLHDSNPEDIVGFISWQVDMEEDEAVIYWFVSPFSANIVTNSSYHLEFNDQE
jgi:hypothetical protein